MPGTKNRATAAVAIIHCALPVSSFLLLRRASHNNDPWSGHFAFPGGHRETGDSNLFATCLRETAEETGIQLKREQLIAMLEPEITETPLSHRVVVQPFLFSLVSRPPVKLDTTEIVKSLWLAEDSFRDQSRHKPAEMFPGRSLPTFPLDDYVVWGFTYRLLDKITNQHLVEKTR